MTSGAQVRPARERDLGGVLALFRCLNEDDAILPEARAASIWAEISDAPGITIYVTEHEARLVAMCTLIVVPNLGRGGRPIAFIENVVTLEDVRRRGFGRAVIEAALAAAWSHGCYKVMLMTGPRLEGVLDFYRSVGFEGGKTALQIRRL